MRVTRSWPALLVVLQCFLHLQVIRANDDTEQLYQATFEELLRSGQLQLESADGISSQQSSYQDPADYAAADTTGLLLWSYEPTCTAHLPQLDSKLCVYTNTSFNNGRGISIFTKPQLANDFALLMQSFESTTIYSYNQTEKAASENWYTDQIPDRGTGMLARQSLKRGDLITSTTPVLVVFKETILPKATREELLQLALYQLPPSAREACLSLATMHDNADILAQDIISANAFLLNVAETAHLAVFPEPSRLNHDCGPNSVWRLDTASLTHIVQVARTLEKDEEITISYNHPLEPFAKRQSYLLRSFGFRCTCRRCKNSKSSDTALAEIVSLQQSLAQWSDTSSDASVQKAERLVRLHEAEGLHGYMDPAYCLAALLYSSVGSQRGTRKYLDLCIEALELRLGPQQEDLPMWRKMRAGA
jgi:hypothetical protein